MGNFLVITQIIKTAVKLLETNIIRLFSNMEINR